MKFLVKEYISLLVSLYRLIFQFEELLNQTKIRTIIVYYEDSCAILTAEIFKAIDRMNQKNRTRQYVWLSTRIKNNHISNYSHIYLGGQIFSIFLIENISVIEWCNENFKFNVDSKHLFLAEKNATSFEIASFFKNIWSHSALNAAVWFWMNETQIYTFLPFQGDFLNKIFHGIHDNQSLPHNIHDKLFKYKDDHLGHTTFEAFILEDTPKSFRTPGRFRLGSTFYFHGRDGLMARALECALHTRWHYRAVRAFITLVDFPMQNGSNVDMVGETIPPDNATINNVLFLNVMRNFSQV